MELTPEVFSPLVTPRSRRRTIGVLAIATVLFVGIFIARLSNMDASNGLLGLQVIPIALVALELGLLPGLGFAVAALGTVVVWAVTKDVHISAAEYAARAAVYFPVAIGIGWIAGRLRVAEQTIENRERRLRTVVESSTDALVTMDAEGLILAWNPVAERLFGWTVDEVLGKDLAEVTMPPRIGEVYREGKRLFLEEDDWSMIGRRFESRALTRDGHEFPIEIAISAVRESDRWIFHVFGHDITERKASQEERNRLANIVDSTGDAILSFTLDGRITSWNPGAERIYGYSQGEAIEMSLYDFVPPDRPDDVAALLDQVQRGERLHNVDYDRIGKAGRHVEVSVTATPIENATGKIVAGAAIHRDVAERRRRERYLTAQHGATHLLAQELWRRNDLSLKVLRVDPFAKQRALKRLRNVTRVRTERIDLHARVYRRGGILFRRRARAAIKVRGRVVLEGENLRMKRSDSRHDQRQREQNPLHHERYSNVLVRI